MPLTEPILCPLRLRRRRENMGLSVRQCALTAATELGWDTTGNIDQLWYNYEAGKVKRPRRKVFFSLAKVLRCQPSELTIDSPLPDKIERPTKADDATAAYDTGFEDGKALGKAQGVTDGMAIGYRRGYEDRDKGLPCNPPIIKTEAVTGRMAEGRVLFEGDDALRVRAALGVDNNGQPITLTMDECRWTLRPRLTHRGWRLEVLDDG